MNSSSFAVLLALVAITSACDTFPNGTETAFHWFECGSGDMNFFNAAPYDATGKTPEYPVHLGAPLMVKTDAYFPHSYSAPNLRNTVSLYSWNTNVCAWGIIPTFGILKDLDACATGIKCPIPAGSQQFDIIMDFSKYQTIINMLKDDSPYQLQYAFQDKQSGDRGCLMVQARARIH